jgi:hypothetical protein
MVSFGNARRPACFLFLFFACFYLFICFILLCLFRVYYLQITEIFCSSCFFLFLFDAFLMLLFVLQER